MAPRLVFYLLKALSNLSKKIRIFARPSYRRFRVIGDLPPSSLVLAWKLWLSDKSLVRVRMREYIMRRSEQEEGRPAESRQNLKSIENMT